MTSFRVILALIAMAQSVGIQAATNSAITKVLSGATEIALHTGVNRVPDFASDGREALVVVGWRGNGNAHGYSLFTILMQNGEQPRDWNIVGVDHKARFEDTVSDDPHTGEDIVSSVRFVRAYFKQRRQSLIVVATRHWKDSIPEPANTTIDVYALARSQGDIGETADFFSRVLTTQSRLKYCNADMALKQEAGLPLPPDYAGSKTSTGCL
ncbi:MAG TPA: hypothetical protein VK533_05650 [Sphingomonas sp.]|uniref:hypothetical protein n=1 Tax=Sphingomonas sp. TaxID=28214 RepID=UPI002CCE9047|nr:hypothetical protein [Sphingomonas sp.]HMI19010.1 hypothetical protein [Sphingomonas sp.]